VDVGGKDRDQERDQSPGGRRLTFRNQKHHAKDDLKNSAYIDKLPMPRQVRRHNLYEEAGADPMKKSRGDKDRGEQTFHHEFEDGHTPLSVGSS
jgi:hypothetical protein